MKTNLRNAKWSSRFALPFSDMKSQRLRGDRKSGSRRSRTNDTFGVAQERSRSRSRYFCAWTNRRRRMSYPFDRQDTNEPLHHYHNRSMRSSQNWEWYGISVAAPHFDVGLGIRPRTGATDQRENRGNRRTLERILASLALITPCSLWLSAGSCDHNISKTPFRQSLPPNRSAI